MGARIHQPFLGGGPLSFLKGHWIGKNFIEFTQWITLERHSFWEGLKSFYCLCSPENVFFLNTPKNTCSRPPPLFITRNGLETPISWLFQFVDVYHGGKAVFFLKRYKQVIFIECFLWGDFCLVKKNVIVFFCLYIEFGMLFKGVQIFILMWGGARLFS